MPPALAELQEHLDTDHGLVDAVTSAASFAMSIMEWPPVHEVTARACAAALATATGVPLVDSFVPLVLAAGTATAGPGRTGR